MKSQTVLGFVLVCMVPFLEGAALIPLLGGAPTIEQPLNPSRDVSGPPGPHEAGPVDPPRPRPTVPPPGAMEHSGPWSRGPFQSIQVNVDAAGHNIVGDAANEPSIAIDPTNPANIVIGWRQFDSVESNFRQAGYAYSHDRGRSWTFPGVLERGLFRSDPVVEADADGNFYYYSLKRNFDCDMFKSTDGGESWIGPIEAFGGDKAWIAIDRTGGMGHGQVYCAWDHFGCCDDNVYSRSIDGGFTYSDPIPIPEFPIWGVTTVGVDGANYVVGRRVGTDREFVLAKSTTVQDPNREPAFDFAIEVNLGGRLVFHDNGPNPGGLDGQVWVATDHSEGESRGNVYVLASVNPLRNDPLDVMFIRSTDGGITWTDPLRVNDDDEKSGAWQWFGTMSVAPNGRIDVVFNDTRNTDTIRRSETFYTFSVDAGTTWASNIPVSLEWDSQVGWPNQNKIGDYYDMISDDAAANLAYAATFNGEQDVYFLRIGDCNENGIHDGADIAEGRSLDANGNGIPDECEGSCERDPEWRCDGDVDGDGQVNPVDSGLVQAAFGSLDDQDLCNYDVDCDGQINPEDSGIVQSLFGTCEAPRNVCP